MGIKRSILFYLILTIIVLISAYFPVTALIAYPLIIVVLYHAKKKEGGFRWGSKWKTGLIYGFFLIFLIFAVELWSGWIKIGELLPDAFLILIVAMIFELFVSAGEEMSFRGYILPDLAGSLGVRRAVLVTSLLFAGLHIPSILTLGISEFNSAIMFTTIMVSGILLAQLYLENGLNSCIGFHFSWNFFQYHVFSLRSGFGIFQLTAERPELTGGAAGPEAGIVGLTLIFLGTSALLVRFPALRKE